MIESKDFVDEVEMVYSLKFLTSQLEKLESENFSTEEQIRIVTELKNKLRMNEVYYNRFKKILARNPDLEFFIRFSKLKSLEDEKIYSYVPLTTTEVERSFSLYRDLLGDRRRSFTVGNLEKYLFIHFNTNK